MKQKFLLRYVKEILKLQLYKLFRILLRTNDLLTTHEMFHLEFFVLSAKYVTLCIMSCC